MAFTNRGIPIPSFGTAESPPATENSVISTTRTTSKKGSKKSKLSGSTSATNTITKTSTHTSNIRIPAQWNAAALMQLEVSLQHWFRRHKKTSMTLEEFYALVKKLDWSQTKTKEEEDAKDSDDREKEVPFNNISAANNTKSSDTKTQTKSHPHDLQVRGLSWAERLWHDLICAAADPALTNPLYKLHVATGTLERLPHTGDQLRGILSSSTATLHKSYSHIVRKMLERHSKLKDSEETAKKQSQQATAAAQQQTAQIVTAPKAAIITAGMTVDERVRARAKAKRDHEQFLEERVQREPPRATDVDKTWMIQLADALWHHARTRLQRQNYRLPSKCASNSLLYPRASKTKNTKSSNNNSRCVMTFADVIQTIAKSRLGEASATQIAKALTELEGYNNPKWIVVMKEYKTDASGGCPSKSKTSFQWSRTATTVFITPDNYPAVRSQLTGIPLSRTSVKIDTSVQKNNIDNKTRVVVTQDTKSKKQANRKRASPVLSKNLLQEFDTTASAALKGPKRVKTS